MGEVHVSVFGEDEEPIASWTTYEEGEHHSDAPEVFRVFNGAGQLVREIASFTWPPKEVGLTFDQLRETNSIRCNRWHHGFPALEGGDGWNAGDWANAMQGEVGEVGEALLNVMAMYLKLSVVAGSAGNTVKKVRRQQEGVRGIGDPAFDALLDELAIEVADVVIYGDLLLAYFGIDLGDAVKRKFNKVSEKQGWPERL